MTLQRKHLIAGQWTGDFTHSFTAFDAKKNEPLPERFANASVDEVNQAIICADQAFYSYSQLSAEKRATFLRTIGEQIVALGNALIERVMLETGLPEARVIGERGRTVGQLNLFANLLEQGEYQAVIEQADNNRTPLPKADTRLGYLPLGVVGVFAASNFPLAFSTAGGDTASALAAGCPVIVKAHTAHPGTSELVAQAILSAITICGVDKGVFSLIQAKDYQVSTAIVTHPLIKAVGFTGSERVGMILQQQINERAEPIPFYGELGSVNPQFLLPNIVKQQGRQLAEGLVASLVMGNGQFCTNPGVWVVIEDEHYPAFEEHASSFLAQQASGVMLTPGICKSYQETFSLYKNIEGVDLLAIGKTGQAHEATPALLATNVEVYAKNPQLQHEIFGACGLIIRCADFSQMRQFVTLLKGNLTASIHAHDEMVDEKALAVALAHKVGRLIYNQMPTGVEVCASMNHGGPFPASTNSRSTSVGSEAIKRFQRPICYQNMPQALLPELLKG